MLLDNRVLTTGYPLLHYSGGCGAEISLGYAEALYEDPVRGIKGTGTGRRANISSVMKM